MRLRPEDYNHIIAALVDRLIQCGGADSIGGAEFDPRRARIVLTTRDLTAAPPVSILIPTDPPGWLTGIPVVIRQIPDARVVRGPIRVDATVGEEPDEGHVHRPAVGAGPPAD